MDITDLGFVEVPLNQTLTYPSGMAAIFRCRYEPRPEILWRVNGAQFIWGPPLESTFTNHDNGSVTIILTIPSNPLYNGTQVECVAYPNGSREVTPVAVLIIMTGGSCMQSQIYIYIIVTL